MRLLEGCSTLYTGFAFRVSVIRAILVCLSITKVILRLLRSVALQFRGRDRAIPLHLPPFKIAMSWSNGLRMKNVVELHVPDVSWSPGVFVMELHCQFWSRDFGGRLPGIVFTAISFLFDEVLESSPVPMTVKYLFYFPLRFFVDDYGR